MPNPLQELAEKLIKTVWPRMPAEALAIDVAEILPILTASVGTLLQAERAAMCEMFVGHRYVTRENEAEPLCSCGYELPEDSEDDCGSYYDHIRTLASASALAAVVQRETAKAVEDTHALWCQVLGVPKSEGMPEDIGTIAKRAIDAAVTAAMSEGHEKHAAYWPKCRQCQIDAKRAALK